MSTNVLKERRDPVAILAIISGLGAVLGVSVFFIPPPSSDILTTMLIWISIPLQMMIPALAIAGPILGILGFRRSRTADRGTRRLAAAGLIIGFLGLVTLVAIFGVGLFGMSVNG